MNVVFHHSNDDPELHNRVTNNIANLLDDSTVEVCEIVLVANSGGLQLLVGDSPQREAVESLQNRGVVFKQCRNTLTGTGTTKADLIDGVELVSSGVGELVRLQAAGYACLRP